KTTPESKRYLEAGVVARSTADRVVARPAVLIRDLPMRPDVLNPLFVELTAVKGVGATLARQLGRLKLTRIVDLLFHLPVMAIDRVRLDTLDEMYVDRTITITITPMTYEPSALRRPFKVNAR